MRCWFRSLSRLIRIADIASLKGNDFERLVAGSETLDDGEASTVAYASEHQIIALLDERRAAAICGRHSPNLIVGSTVDLLALECVDEALEVPFGINDAAYQALIAARMRVLPRIIGIDSEPHRARTRKVM